MLHLDRGPVVNGDLLSYCSKHFPLLTLRPSSSSPTKPDCITFLAWIALGVGRQITNLLWPPASPNGLNIATFNHHNTSLKRPRPMGRAKEHSNKVRLRLKIWTQESKGKPQHGHLGRTGRTKRVFRRKAYPRGNTFNFFFLLSTRRSGIPLSSRSRTQGLTDVEIPFSTITLRIARFAFRLKSFSL